MRFALVCGAIDGHAFDEVVGGVAELLGGQVELVVGLVLHEVVVVAVLVQELHRARFEDGPRPLLRGLERALQGAAALDVLELDADLRRAATHLDVVELQDLP